MKFLIDWHGHCIFQTKDRPKRRLGEHPPKSILRNPLKRFISACSQPNINPKRFELALKFSIDWLGHCIFKTKDRPKRRLGENRQKLFDGILKTGLSQQALNQIKKSQKI